MQFKKIFKKSQEFKIPQTLPKYCKNSLNFGKNVDISIKVESFQKSIKHK